MINEKSLSGISDNGKMIFSENESRFLAKYAPMEFFDNYGIKTDYAIDEAKIIIYDILIKLDISVARGKRVDELAKDKIPVANKLLGNILKISDNPIKDVYELKFALLDYLDSNKRMYPDKSLRISEDKFIEEKIELTKMFGDVPIMIYGSSVQGKNSDRDSMVFLSEMSYELFSNLPHIVNGKREIPLQIVLMPKKYIDGFVNADFEGLLSDEKSVFINGSLEYNPLDVESLSKLKLHRAANQIFELRRSLTPQGLEECRILPRVNYRLKMPKFINQYWDYCYGFNAPFEILSFNEMPQRDELIKAFVETNLKMSKHIDYIISNLLEI